MANYDFLKPVLGDELYSQFSEKMNGAEGITLANIANGSYIPKQKFDDELNTSKAYKAQIDDLNTKLSQMQKDIDGNEALKAKITELQTDITKRDEQMKKQRLDYTIRDAVRDSKARNADIVVKMIDVSKITEKNGKIYGLDEQIEALKQSDAYLFTEENGGKGGVDPHQEPTGGKPGSNYSVNEMIRRAAGR